MAIDKTLNILRNHWCFTSLEYVEAMQVVDAHIVSQAAQIEAMQRSLAIVQSAAKTLVAAKDERHAHMAREYGMLSAAAADVAGERAANAALTDENERLRAQIEALTKDAARYRALREMTWDSGPMCVVHDPRAPGAIRLATYCPCGTLLDREIDAAIKAKEAK